jgi:capsular polysaccharide biosynthesis protein
MTTATCLLGRRIPVIAICVLAFAMVGFLTAELRAARYTASATLVFRSRTVGETLLVDRRFSGRTVPSVAATERALLSPSIAAAAARSLPDGASAAAVADEIEVEGNPSTEVVTVSATDEEPERAAAIANAYAERAIDFYGSLARQRVAAKIRALRQSSAGNGKRLAPASRRSLVRLQTLEALQVGNLELAQAAAKPTDPSSPEPLTVALLAALVGLGIGSVAPVLLTWGREVRDPRALERGAV